MGIFTSKLPFTEVDVPQQDGKVFIVTGSSGGLGKLLAGLLYSRNGKVYIAARNQSKAQAAIDDIKSQYPSSKGQLIFLHLDLNDLSTIKESAATFLAAESRLDVLWNNAGVMIPPQGSKTAQGYELQLGTNVLAPFLFTRLLEPVLQKTAEVAPVDSVRVVWLTSNAIDMAPKQAIDLTNMDYHTDEGAWIKYARSKVGNIVVAAEYTRKSRSSSKSVLHIPVHPGVYMTDLQRTMPWYLVPFVVLLGRPVIEGAYTELFAGFHKSITPEYQSKQKWVEPKGQLTDCTRPELFEDKLGEEYWNWLEEHIKPFV